MNWLIGGFASLVLMVIGIFITSSLMAPNEELGDRESDALRVATHNVHYIDLGNHTFGDWSGENWTRRKTSLDMSFKAINADIFAFQEMESFEGRAFSTENLALNWLLQENPEYAAAAVGDPEKFPFTQPIFYHRDRLQVIDQGWFYFSDTPDKIYSRTFDGSFPAYASWVQFLDLSSLQHIYVYNVHLDYKSRSNRTRSINLVQSRIARHIDSDERVILLGDFNARKGSDTMKIVTGFGLEFQPVSGSTYHFNRGINLFGAIDHIATSNSIKPNGHAVTVGQKFDGVWPSDHYAVVLDISLK